jgi:hypothetical protein
MPAPCLTPAGAGFAGMTNYDPVSERRYFQCYFLHINCLKIVKTLLHKIPPNLPLLKGGIIPLFGKEGRGEIF